MAWRMHSSSRTLLEGTVKYVLISTLLLALVGCQGPDQPSAADADKEDVADSKADGADVCWFYGFEDGCDLCDEFGWYGDDVCDQTLVDAGICLHADPDCAVSFGRFRSGTSGMCPPEVDCSSFIELLADGTLRVDLSDDIDGGIHEATISAEDLAEAVAILTAPALVELLALADPPCVAPMDIWQSMELEMNGETYENGVTFCDDAPIEAAREILESLRAEYIVVTTEVNFGRFRSQTSGFCPPEVDCTSSIELLADGTLRVDLSDDIDGGIHEATISAADLADAVAILTAPALVGLLALDDPPCVAPTDIWQSMELEMNGEAYENGVTFCDDAPIEAAREILESLRAEYIVVTPEVNFGRFRSETNGFCPPEVDCTSSIELLADGTLRVDLSDDIDGGIHEATISAADLADAVAILTAPALVGLLALDDPPCVAPTDIWQSMELEMNGETYENGVTFCDDAPIVAAREILADLSSAYITD